METLELQVEGMSCQHCVQAIQKAVGVLPGVESVTVDLESGTVRVQVDNAAAEPELIIEAIEGEGYDVAE